MRLAVCTIQKNRAKWIEEWVVFHSLVGVNRFYIFLHDCTDNSAAVVARLMNHFDIKCYTLTNDILRPQLAAYNYCYEHHGHEVDWLAFIDGDEFLYSPAGDSLPEVIRHFNYRRLSGLAAYWRCFGSSGHINDPEGLIIEDYKMRAADSFLPNRHVKSIIKGGQGMYCQSAGNSHIFNTIYGIYDEKMRLVDKGWMKEYEPAHELLCINHYVCQSYEYYVSFKKFSGAADAGASMVRAEDWWLAHDTNDFLDKSLNKYVEPVLRIIENI